MALRYPSYRIGVHNSHLDFFKSFQKGLGTTVKLVTTFNPQMDGQEESTIQNLKVMLRACIVFLKGAGIGIYHWWTFLQQ